MGKPSKGRNRVVIEHIEPEMDCGRFPIKRIVGETVRVRADVFADGHDEVRARLLWKRDGETDWRWVEMSPLGNDRWQGEFPTERIGRYAYTVAGEIDRFGSWRSDLREADRGEGRISEIRRSRRARPFSSMRLPWPRERMPASLCTGPRCLSGRAAIPIQSGGA